MDNFGKIEEQFTSGSPPTLLDAKNTYNTDLEALGLAITEVKTNLQGNLDSVFNPQTGLMYSLNCLVIG
jgi:hypothetical protein